MLMFFLVWRNFQPSFEKLANFLKGNSDDWFRTSSQNMQELFAICDKLQQKQVKIFLQSLQTEELNFEINTLKNLDTIKFKIAVPIDVKLQVGGQILNLKQIVEPSKPAFPQENSNNSKFKQPQDNMIGEDQNIYIGHQKRQEALKNLYEKLETCEPEEIRVVILSMNNFQTSDFDKIFEKLKPLANLEYLNLSNNYFGPQLWSKINSLFEHFKQLKWLALIRTDVGEPKDDQINPEFLDKVIWIQCGNILKLQPKQQQSHMDFYFKYLESLPEYLREEVW